MTGEMIPQSQLRDSERLGVVEARDKSDKETIHSRGRKG